MIFGRAMRSKIPRPGKPEELGLAERTRRCLEEGFKATVLAVQFVVEEGDLLSIGKPHAIHRQALFVASGEPSVDNMDDPVNATATQQQAESASSTPQRELREIAQRAGLSKGQLGKILVQCRTDACRLQDVYRAAGGYLEKLGLTGGRAMQYLIKCLAENPGRDWTWEARRGAQEAARAAEAAAEDHAHRAAVDRLLEAGSSGVLIESPRTGLPVILVATGQAELVEVFDAQRRYLGVNQIRSWIESLNANGESRKAA
jgi:hypothetical protein